MLLGLYILGAIAIIAAWCIILARVLEHYDANEAVVVLVPLFSAIIFLLSILMTYTKCGSFWAC